MPRLRRRGFLKAVSEKIANHEKLLKNKPVVDLQKLKSAKIAREFVVAQVQSERKAR